LQGTLIRARTVTHHRHPGIRNRTNGFRCECSRSETVECGKS